MPLGASSHSAAFVVRVWLDGDLLRARITETLDLADRCDETVTLTGSTDEVERRLHSWLEAFSGNGQ